MLTIATLSRFQRHKRLKLDFGSLTCITGETGAGKSAVVRALYWLAFNRPLGKEMIQHGRAKCVVTVEVDGRTIKRVRGKRSNYYELDGKRFDAISQGVPDEIARLLNLSDINFQLQLDSPFWLTDPAPKVSRELNAVVSLEVIDSTLANTATSVRQSKAELEVCESRLKTAREELAGLDWVPGMVKEVEEVAAREEDLKCRRIKCSRLRSLLASGAELDRKRQRSSEAKTEALATDRLGSAYFQRAERVARLGELIETAKQLYSKSKVAVENVPTLLYEKVVKARQRMSRLGALVEKAKQHEEVLCRSRQSLTATEGELSQVRFCPLCESPLKDGR